MEKKKKLVYIEVIRIISIAFVMLNHLPFVNNYQSHEGPVRMAYLFFVVFTRSSIPAFFMLSGSLLLSKDEPLSVLLKKRILRFAVLLVVMNLMSYLATGLVSYVHGEGAKLSVWDFITRMFAGKVEGTYTLWFIYAYLSLLFMLPVLRPAAAHFGWGEYLLFFAMHFILVSVVPLFNLFAKLKGFDGIELGVNLSFPVATVNCFFYALTGYFVDRRLDIKKVKASSLAILGIISFAAVAISAAGLDTANGLKGEYPEKYYLMSEYISGIFFFIFVKYFFTKRHPKLSEGKHVPFICFVGSLTFGVYLLDPFMKMAIYNPYIKLAGSHAYSFVFCLGWVVISFTLCGAATFILKKIPLVKELL